VADYLIWGATGQAKVVREALVGSNYRLVTMVDNRQMPSPFPGVPVLSGLEGLQHWLRTRGNNNDLYGVVAIGGGKGCDRVQIISVLENLGLKILEVRHPTAFVADDAVVGAGCQLLAQSAVCTHTRLGTGVIVNTSASVDHDCKLADGVHIGPGAHLAGEVVVGANSFVGTGAIVLPRIAIGDGVTVGAGAVVTKDIPDGLVVSGNPARLHRSH